MNALARRLVAGWLVATVAACSPALDKKGLQELSAEATALLQDPGVGHWLDVPPARWPKTIRSLSPDRVYVGTSGLYIVTGSFFPEEWGYFVPANKTNFSPAAGGDPSYENLGYDVYRYEIKG